ncbi:hypothetical protein CKM354_000162100 [Cercospora kikuchii]|uniref:RING-type E3 ubiquitin transferase n=1 Tax=Cercospora kikuchii TaxID=84275 RepID=A0A9P3C8E3_9PEZI|nr:uncharacterized protein CKM354_000162100 [Cercospora kikuchii]GIZ38198.1 hypothetical protein CKM354_000162100 [Cercospora kikuchii]
MRLAYYAGASTLAAAACLLKAFSQRPNFYSATVYLSQSNACLLILTNLMLLLSTSFLYLLQRLLYGPLRPIEIEQLSEKAWYAVLDTLLAMPSFREDVGGRLLVMFVLLLAGKVWGWIGEGRVDVLEQGQMMGGANNKLFHARLATSLLISLAFAIGMFKYCLEVVIEDPRPGMMVIFTFEFAILCVFSLFTAIRYGLAVWEIKVTKEQTVAAIEQRKEEIKAEREAAIAKAREEDREVPTFDEPIDVDENEVDVPGWEDKRRVLFVVEVVTDFVKLVIYIFFFTVSVTFNGLPMHIMRDVYMTFASFSKRVTDYMAYRKATSDMNTRYPDATTAEIRGDACIVCREEMVAWAEGEPQAAAPGAGADGQPAAAPAPAPAPARRRDEGMRAKKLPCGHILHLRCLKAWLERQQVCPTCRRPVVAATPAAGNAGNAAAPAQNGQPGQQPPRPRGRIFNLGPLRIGMVNAPRGQIQNVLNQIRNGDAQAVQQALDPAGNPVAGGAGQQQPAAGRPWNAGSQVPTHVQLLQLEQRIVREAHNLGIEQQQLNTLRMMEAELARLRAQHISAPPTGITRYPMPGFSPQHQLLPSQLHGNPSQQMSSGHEHLPPGTVLPEGWTVLPLQPAMNLAAPQQSAGLSGPRVSNTGGVAQAPSRTQDSASAQSETVSSQAPASVAQNGLQSSTPGPQGPVDERGSPLFVPVNTSPAQDNTSSTQQPDSAALRAAEERGEAAGRKWAAAFASSNDSASLPNTSTRGRSAAGPPGPGELVSGTTPNQAPPQTTQTPWNDSGWSFNDQSQQDSQSEIKQSTTRINSSLPTAQSAEQGDPEQSQSYSGKGKAKAVEVEDVPDPEA